MICIRQTESEEGRLCWTAEDSTGEIGRMMIKTGAIPEVILLEFEQPEIGDGLIKTAAAFFTDIGVAKLRFCVHSEHAEAAASAAGFLKTESGFEINPARVKRSCGGQ